MRIAISRSQVSKGLLVIGVLSTTLVACGQPRTSLGRQAWRGRGSRIATNLPLAQIQLHDEAGDPLSNTLVLLSGPSLGEIAIVTDDLGILAYPRVDARPILVSTKNFKSQTIRVAAGEAPTKIELIRDTPPFRLEN